MREDPLLINSCLLPGTRVDRLGRSGDHLVVLVQLLAVVVALTEPILLGPALIPGRTIIIVTIIISLLIWWRSRNLLGLHVSSRSVVCRFIMLLSLHLSTVCISSSNSSLNSILAVRESRSTAQLSVLVSTEHHHQVWCITSSSSRRNLAASLVVMLMLVLICSVWDWLPKLRRLRAFLFSNFRAWWRCQDHLLPRQLLLWTRLMVIMVQWIGEFSALALPYLCTLTIIQRIRALWSATRTWVSLLSLMILRNLMIRIWIRIWLLLSVILVSRMKMILDSSRNHLLLSRMVVQVTTNRPRLQELLHLILRLIPTSMRNLIIIVCNLVV